MMKSRFLPFSLIARPLSGGVPANQNSLFRKKFPWLNYFKKLQEIKSAGRITCSFLGCKKGGCRQVPGDDTAVHPMTKHVVDIINWMCNTTFPYKVQDIVYPMRSTHEKYKVGFHKKKP